MNLTITERLLRTYVGLTAGTSRESVHDLAKACALSLQPPPQPSVALHYRDATVSEVLELGKTEPPLQQDLGPLSSWSVALNVAGPPKRSVSLAGDAIHGVITLTAQPQDKSAWPRLVDAVEAAFPPEATLDAVNSAERLAAAHREYRRVLDQIQEAERHVAAVRQVAQAAAEQAAVAGAAAKEVADVREQALRLAQEAKNAQEAVAKHLVEVRENAQAVENRRATVDAFANSVTEIRGQMDSMLQAGSTRLKQLEDSATAARDALTNEAKELTVEVRTVSENRLSAVDSSLAELRTSIRDDLSEALARFSADSMAKLVAFQDHVTQVTHRSGSMQAEIERLLQGAVAGRLSHTFQERKAEIERNLRYRLIGVVLSTLAVSVVAYVFFFMAGIAPAWDALFAAKLAATLPLVLLDLFLIRQYSVRHRLLEEYAFKSAISLTMVAYQEQVQSKEATDHGRQFIVDTAKRIYEHPLSELPRRTELKELRAFAEKALGAGERVGAGAAKRAVDNLTKTPGDGA